MTEFRLPWGVTGFGDRRRVPSIRNDMYALKVTGHAAARAVGGEVSEVVPAELYWTYHQLFIDYDDERIAVLCNIHVPLIGLVQLRNGHVARPFLYAPNASIAEVFAATDPFVVLTKEQFDAEPTGEVLSELGSGELNQFGHWKPQTVAEVVFNWWD